MATVRRKSDRRGSITLMIVGLLAMLFVIVSSYITLARFNRVTDRRFARAKNVDDTINSINDLIRSLMRQQFVDANGHLFGGSYFLDGNLDGIPDSNVSASFEDVAGHGSSRFGGSLEPFFDFSATSPNFQQSVGSLNFRRFVTSTGPKEGTGVAWSVPSLPGITPLPGVSMRQLVASQAFSFADATRKLFDITDIDGDWAQLARNPFMDADGDGVPDASFEHTTNLQELANAIAGRIVRAPNVPAGNLMAQEMWRRFDQSARYEVAVRVVPHGGMVALDSFQDPLQLNDPIGPRPFNRNFVREMFNWVIHPSDSAAAPNAGNRFWNELFLSRRAVEPVLRRRGMLAAFQDGNTPARIPEVLRDLENDYPNTFRPTFGRRGNDASSQRFNIAPSGDGIVRWAKAMRLAPPTSFGGPIPSLDLNDYDRRHLITSISSSDELARPQADTGGPALGPPLGIKPGQLKFYLGRIMQGAPGVAPAFDAVGNFDPGDLLPNGRRAGLVQILELANLFSTMLSGHNFANEADVANTVREQAFMLAVNTVAFAAPRAQSGFIDVVSFVDSTDSKLYVGYAPQPFFSEAMMYFDHNNNIGPEDVALAVEFHNPNEPTDPALGPDEQALDLTQFAIGFEPDGAAWFSPNESDATEGRDYRILSNVFGPQMSGRTTVAFAIHSQTSDNTFFEDPPSNLPFWSVPDVIPVGIDSGAGTASITLNLWRQGSSGVWYLVDRILLSHDDLPGPDIDWYVTTNRDTTDDNLYEPGTPPVPPSSTARWGVALAEIAGGIVAKGDPPPDDPVEQPDASSLGTPDLPAVTTRVAPAPPLYTMNAGFDLNSRLVMHNGDARPVSFPTPGFMLFVPRFASVDGMPVSEVLKQQWDSMNVPPEVIAAHDYPADFGHMPIFDNRQSINDLGLFNQAVGAGKLPWGLLVFDYFTTIDPNRIPGGDPLHVPGRININAAPWYVMAGLPVIRPAGASGLGDLPIVPQPNPWQAPSPAFWDNAAGILVGDADPTRPPRFDIGALAGGERVDNVWYRLGTKLALEAVSYRDRAAYVDPTGFPANIAPSSFNRNVSADLNFPSLKQYRNESTYGPLRRESGTTDSKKYGFVSIGELLNVKGFDTATTFDVDRTGFPRTDFHLSEVLHPGVDSLAIEHRPDFMKAVSLMALLETQFLTTRSNTFTVYVTVFDRENPQSSVRSQVTVDRGNTLPKLTTWFNPNGIPGLQPEPVTLESNALPEIVAERRIGYFNTRFDD